MKTDVLGSILNQLCRLVSLGMRGTTKLKFLGSGLSYNHTLYMALGMYVCMHVRYVMYVCMCTCVCLDVCIVRLYVQCMHVLAVQELLF